jgi:hypothetical protein
MRMSLNEGGGNQEYATVEEVHVTYDASPGGNTNTIGQIIYDAGTTGLCTIQPQYPIAGLARNASLILNSSEHVRIISVTNGANGISSFRCKTTGTFTAGQSIHNESPGSFWIYLQHTHSTGETLLFHNQNFDINSSGAGSGQVQWNTSTPLNLAVAGGRAVSVDDYIHLSIWSTDSSQIVEFKMILDVDSATTGTANASTDGTKNAYFYVATANDFQQVSTASLTNQQARTQAITTELQAQSNITLESNIPPSGAVGQNISSIPQDVAHSADSTVAPPVLISASSQLYAGATQWTELNMKIGDFVRIGTDRSVDLSAVRAIIFKISVANGMDFSLGGLWVGGTYGPDSDQGFQPYLYRYRYRASTIGARSLPGPALRTGINARRQGIQISMTSSSDPQVDKIDIERLGGSNTDGWHYLGTVSNTGSPPQITDDLFDAAIATQAPLETNVMVPFVLSGAPLNLTATIAGTAVHVTTGTVNLNMKPGTIVVVGGYATTVYAYPTSTTLFHVADNLGYGTSIKVEIREPILTGQPLPVMWGPFEGCMLAVGNGLDAGSLYWTNPNDPDSSTDANRVTICGPHEMLMNGIIYDGRCYVWSDRRMFAVTPNQDPNGNLGFTAVEIPNSKGLAGRWAFSSGPLIYFVAPDGIYQTGGGPPEMISQAIRPLFPQGDNKGIAVRGVQPVIMDNLMKLEYSKGFLYFDFNAT